MEKLRTVGLTKVYRNERAETVGLAGVDFQVEEGEFVAIMGPSGCGKSTLLHMLGGLDRPTKGEVYLGTQRIDGLSEAALAIMRRRRVGYMFQSFNLVTNMSAADNIELPALLAGFSAREATRRRVALMEQLGLSSHAKSSPGRMSGGEQQRVALARALVNQPDVLLADEPTGNLDSQSSRDVIEILRNVRQQGQTVVLVTHDPNVASFADRVVRMRDGLIAGESRLEGREPSIEILRSLISTEV